MICRHCHHAAVCRPRGLCWSCYYAPGVRDRYPSKGKSGRRGIGNFHRATPLPAFATDAVPGTPEKVAILAERARLQQTLWHPGDATFAGPRNPVLQTG